MSCRNGFLRAIYCVRYLGNGYSKLESVVINKEKARERPHTIKICTMKSVIMSHFLKNITCTLPWVKF